MAKTFQFEKTLTLGNVIQILLIAGGLAGGYFGMKASIDANTRAIEQNIIHIKNMQAETESLDVLSYKVDQLSQAIMRVEEKLDD